ncbi:Flagellar motor switch protein FliG [Cronobacter sakazakii]|nr:Flagellar motor switch protein FliG [Cronobacter sakazakii]
MSNANSNANANGLSGTDKSAILLMTIGEDRAAEVFKTPLASRGAAPQRRDGERASDL